MKGSYIALITFIAILAYHVFQQLRHNKLWKKVPKFNLEFRKLNNKEGVENLMNDLTESVNLDQLHELLLDDITLLTCSVV